MVVLSDQSFKFVESNEFQKYSLCLFNQENIDSWPKTHEGNGNGWISLLFTLDIKRQEEIISFK